MDPLVSIVVTTKNEEANIGNCLRSLVEQTYTNLELIVVDNDSTDDTKEIARKYTSLVYNKGPERSAQRNEGLLHKAHGKYCAYFDADMVMSKFLIEDSVRQLEASELLGLYVPEIVLGNSLFARVRRFERQFYDGTVIDAARFFRRDPFVKVGGFSEDIFKSGSGEDWDLDKSIRLIGEMGSLKANHPASDLRAENKWLLELSSDLGVDIPAAFNGILHNESEDKLIPYLRKKRYYATGFQRYIDKWGINDRDVQRQFGPTYRLFTVFTESQKWRKILRNPFLFLGTLGLKILLGLVTVNKFRKRTMKSHG
jgi:glycosyltransferase involved in cell wall biosynthesis